jgi:hypothetical protein
VIQVARDISGREPVSRDEAIARLRSRAAEWSTTDCEEICSHEIGDTIHEFLVVLGLEAQD